MARSPSGVAMGVSGDAQTAVQIGSCFVSHFQIPSWQVTLSPHGSDTHAVPEGKSHAAPSFPAISGQGAIPFGAYAQFQTRDACGRPPQRTAQPGTSQQPAQPQYASVYPHAVVSGTVQAPLGTDAGQPAASWVQFVGGPVTVQCPLAQSARERQSVRGALPYRHGPIVPEHDAPSAGMSVGQRPLVEPPVPGSPPDPALPPAPPEAGFPPLPAAPPLVLPPFELPPVPTPLPPVFTAPDAPALASPELLVAPPDDRVPELSFVLLEHAAPKSMALSAAPPSRPSEDDRIDEATPPGVLHHSRWFPSSLRVTAG
jgi:hypothetical protein